MGMTVKLTFGKYRNWYVCEVPLSYLAWLWESDFIKEDLRESVHWEIRQRVGDGASMGNEVVVDKKRLQQIYRSLARDHHPDHGGDNNVMAGINLFYEALSQ